MKGILLVNKPIGYSTFDVIRDFKRATSFKGKVGHAGTLDVFANGLVILMVNTTKEFAKFQELKKHYTASVRLDVSSNTLDVEGNLNHHEAVDKLTKEQILDAIQKHTGEYEQAIPSFSAAKQGGQPLYKLARENKQIVSKSKTVHIYSINLIAYKHPIVTIEVACGSGTYIRQLSYDIFQSLNTQSFLFSLTRTQIGEYQLNQAIEITDFSSSDWENKLINIE